MNIRVSMMAQQSSEIRNVARKWIEKYDDDVLDEMKLRLDELRAHGEKEAYILWLSIFRETRSLMKAREAHIWH